MTGYLLDTNIVSELTKDTPHSAVISFLEGQDDLWLSAILIHEVEYGLRLLPQSQRRNRLSAMQSGIVQGYANRILPLTATGAEWAAEFRVRARRAGRTIDLGDALTAGVAKANLLVLVTRNVRDFAGLDVDVFNPWEDP